VPRLLIKVKKAVWQKTKLPSFLASEDVPADCLADLRIKDNKLSVWYVSDDDSNLKRLLTALAASGDYLTNVDYLLFDYAIVSKLRLRIRKTDGGTPDRHANREWHHDLVELSGRNVLDLAVTMLYDSAMGRELEKTLSGWITKAIANNEIDASILRPKLAARVVPTAAKMPTISRFVRMCGKVCSSAGEAWHEFRHG